ncbi:hypothetical protein PC116_g34666 [Phytophthora cactorum]|nr:hypothetical protein PC116_g34666 [Phytophthora cactorum]
MVLRLVPCDVAPSSVALSLVDGAARREFSAAPDVTVSEVVATVVGVKSTRDDNSPAGFDSERDDDSMAGVVGIGDCVS